MCVMRVSLLIFLLMMIKFAMSQSVDKNHKVKFLALGDSYTIGESVSPRERWPEQLIQQLLSAGYQCDEVKIIATTGWRTDDLKRAIEQAALPKDFTLVSLLIGVNNQYQGKSATSYEPEFEDLLKIAIEHAGGKESNVFVVSIPDYGYTPFAKEKQTAISNELDQFNEINKRITEKYGCTYIYITDISRQGLQKPELVAEDGLHPSGEMYRLWVERIKKQLINK